MELLGLPTEVFEAILFYAIVGRGIKRGVRLRLVNSKHSFTLTREGLIEKSRAFHKSNHASPQKLPATRQSV